MTRTLTRRTTAADVAREAGVSPATVGFVLNRTKGQTISEETRARVLAAVEVLNYKPHHAARALRSGKSKIVLLVLPDWPLEHSLRTNLEALTHTLGDNGYALITFTPQPHSSATPLWAVLEPAVVIGYKPFSAEDLAELKALGIRNIIPNPETPGMGAAADLESGPRLQAEHLLSLGHTKLGFACPPDPRLAAFVKTRLDVVTRVCIRAGLSSPVVRQVDYRDGSGPSAAAHWVAEGVTGVVAYNDDVAADVIAGAVRSGLSVPGDLCVVGHDNSPLASRYIPSISSVEIDMESLGKQSAHLALNLAEGYPMPASPLSAASLVHRESTTHTTRNDSVLRKSPRS
ncbi:LacI family DNA-binding transcriptional regulator [Paenarthrobacter histidinolovorans]|uniref:LacI family DNA-binding transcriptional regulator n=1 Tax=Paenarthrobacter histidinolovorans TaxID=43664 RepID=UPI00166578DA|nr:LacI family DNA-binding transcriptional regulator [Paenarthrobacter histidinolovorans]GGJ21897.1 LacI family transcriptional regulator [Paenarthrobacter histidinolovorans]